MIGAGQARKRRPEVQVCGFWSGPRQRIADLKGRPARPRFDHHMAFERLPEGSGDTVIKEYEHQALGWRAGAAARQGFALRIR